MVGVLNACLLLVCMAPRHMLHTYAADLLFGEASADNDREFVCGDYQRSPITATHLLFCFFGGVQ